MVRGLGGIPPPRSPVALHDFESEQTSGGTWNYGTAEWPGATLGHLGGPNTVAAAVRGFGRCPALTGTVSGPTLFLVERFGRFLTRSQAALNRSPQANDQLTTHRHIQRHPPHRTDEYAYPAFAFRSPSGRRLDDGTQRCGVPGQRRGTQCRGHAHSGANFDPSSATVPDPRPPQRHRDPRTRHSPGPRRPAARPGTRARHPLKPPRRNAPRRADSRGASPPRAHRPSPLLRGFPGGDPQRDLLTGRGRARKTFNAFLFGQPERSTRFPTTVPHGSVATNPYPGLPGGAGIRYFLSLTGQNPVRQGLSI